MANIYSSIHENNINTVLLIVLFPVTLMLFVAGALVTPRLIILNKLLNAELLPLADKQLALDNFHHFLYNDLLHTCLIILGGGFLWVFLSYLRGSNVILTAAGAKIIDKNDPDYKELYRITENISITAGIKCPNVYVINDESCNAFATGTTVNNSAVTFTTGILKTLNKQEIEGVAAHEISHILNRDVRTMMLMISCIGICTLVGEYVLRAGLDNWGGRAKKESFPFILLGLAFYAFGYIFAPLMRLATSRQQEYRADANAALLTRNPLALASALEKISLDARVESLDSQKLAAAICIANPSSKEGGFFAFLSGLTKTHPPIEKRVELLKSMGR